MKRLSFTAQNRILARPDFLRCYDNGYRCFSDNFVLFVFKHKDPEDNFSESSCSCGSWRVGLAVSRKTGNAVVRNRVKRLLREFFRQHQTSLPCNTDMVVVPKKSLEPKHLNYKRLEAEFLPLLPALLKPHFLARPPKKQAQK